ncbi:MAG: TonB-dependent receptor [Gammaproteobacteria bacterium]|nr:MAG: TonB-dependent receptor [Gammaproteobacteria bacterium]
MKMRKGCYCLFFLALPIVSVAVVQQQDNIVPPVVVKAVKKIHSSITSGPEMVITRQQITTTGETSLSQVLQNLGGVQLQDMAGNGSQVSLSMRGFGTNATSNTLMLINGVPITNPDMASPDLNSIPLYDIQYIEIVAGSESVLYGDQAVGGVVNIVTREQATEKAAMSCSAGSYHQYNCYLTFNHHYDRLNNTITFGDDRSDNYREHNHYDQQIVSGRLDFPYQENKLSFDYKVANEFMQYPGALTAAQVRQDRQQASNATDYFRDWSGFFHVRSQQALSENWQLATDLARREMHGHGVLFSQFNQSRDTNYLRPELKGLIGHAIVRGGLDVEADDYHLGSQMGLTENDQQKYGLFGLTTIPLQPRWAISLGARGAEQTSRLESSPDDNTINRAFATTIGTTYQFMHDTDMYLRRAESFRFPKADENADTPTGVTGLRTQRGVAYETGIHLNRENYSATLGVYQLNLRDEIAFDPTQTEDQPFGTNRNLSPTLRRGLTLSGKDKLTDKLTLDGQYNYVDAEFQNGVNEGNRIPLVSENIFRTGLDYQFALHWSLYSEAVYTGSQYSANDDANVAGKIGGYVTVNGNLRYVRKQWVASLHVNNIFNKNYYLYTVYEPDTQSVSFYPAPGRDITLTVNYAFL